VNAGRAIQPFNIETKKEPRISPRLFSCRALSVASEGTDSDADAGGADADAATVLIAAALDIAPAGRISVRIAGLMDDDAAFTTFAPAVAILVANHADGLNVALGCEG
jgi:hypothetical protein